MPRDVDERWNTASPDPASPAPDLTTVIRELLDAIEAMVSHERSSDDVVLELEARGYRLLVQRSSALVDDPARGLSPREREIATMVARGFTNKAIATSLSISIFTVDSHLRRIFAKLGVMNRAGAVGVLTGMPLAQGVGVPSRVDDRSPGAASF